MLTSCCKALERCDTDNTRDTFKSWRSLLAATRWGYSGNKPIKDSVTFIRARQASKTAEIIRRWDLLVDFPPQHVATKNSAFVLILQAKPTRQSLGRMRWSLWKGNWPSTQGWLLDVQRAAGVVGFRGFAACPVSVKPSSSWVLGREEERNRQWSFRTPQKTGQLDTD